MILEKNLILLLKDIMCCSHMESHFLNDSL